MLPEWPVGTVYTVIAVPFRALKEGDVVVYWDFRGTFPIMHQFVRRDRWGQVVVRGTNNHREDRVRVTEDSYIGVATRLTEL